MLPSAYFLTHIFSLLHRAAPGRLVGALGLAATALWAVAALFVFHRFSVLTYAHLPLTADNVSK